MAKNRIEIDVEVDDKGKTKKLGLESKKAAKGLDDVGKGARTADRNLKGAAQASSNSTKNFSKMAQGTGGLVAAYATLAANIFAISAAYGFLKRAGDVAALTRGQEAYAMKTGKSMKLLTDRIQEATGGILSFNDASQAAAIGQAAGLSNDQLTGLARVAKNASVALGRDLTDSFNRLTRGAIKAEPELLDELGIIIRLDKVTKDYSRTLGKNADDLTQFEKSQAVVNAVLAQGVEKFDEVGQNVNQVARLGKGFSDLVKGIGEFIDPLSSFLSGALANNIHGLAAAFSVLGLSIGKALMPAMPAMAGVSEMAEGASQRLAGVAGTGPTADKIREGDFGKGTISAIERASKSSTSTVLDLSKANRQQVTRDLLIIKAHHQATLAANETGVKKWYLTWKANLAALQAEHGKTMGLLKAGTATFVSGVNKLLSAVAFIGMLYTAITLVKELMNALKDDRIKEIEQNAKLLQERFEGQNKEVRKLMRGFEEANSPMETLVKQANILSNFSFSGFEGLTKTLGEAKQTVETIVTGPGQAVTFISKDLPDQNREVTDSMVEMFESVKLQSTAFAEFGLKSTEASTKVEQGIIKMSRPLDVLSGKIPSTAEEYNAALTLLQEGFEGLIADAQKLNPILAAQAQAVKAISQSAEGFQKFRESLRQTSSQFSQFLDFNKQFTDQLSTLSFSGTAQEFFVGMAEGSQDGATKLAAFADALGMTTEEAGKLTRLELITKFQEQAKAIRAQEFAITRKQVQTDILLTNAVRGRSALQVAEMNRLAAVQKVKNQILAVENQMKFLNDLGVTTDDTRMQQEQDKLDLLNAQLLTAQQLADESERQVIAAKNAMEGTAKTEIADLIKGNKSSIGDAMKAIAKSAVDAVADNLAERAAKAMTDFLFGSPDKALEVELQANTAALNANTQALGGTPAAGGGAPSALGNGFISSARDSIKGFFTMPEKQKIGPQIGSGTTGLGTMTGTGTITSPTTGGAISVDEIVTTAKGGAGEGNLKALFQGFTANLQEIFSGDTPFLEGLGNLFKDMGTDFKGIFSGLGDTLGGLFGDGGFLKDMLGGIGGFFGFGGGGAAASGGIFAGGSKLSGYAAGGIASGSTGGYPAILHGTEAVVPLPNNKKIPVEMKNGGEQNNNITVNVASDGGMSTQGNTGGVDQERLGRAIASAVKTELQNQKRSGGMLNPYGAS